MSQILTQVKAPLWKPGTKSNNIEFLSSFKRLQQEDPKTYNLIKQEEGYVYQTSDYEYKVGRNNYGLWASRRGLEGKIEDKPPARPSGFAPLRTEKLELTQEEIAYLKQFVAFMKVVK